MKTKKEDGQSMTRDEKKLIREIYLFLQECADKAGPSYLHERISRSKARCVSLLELIREIEKFGPVRGNWLLKCLITVIRNLQNISIT